MLIPSQKLTRSGVAAATGASSTRPVQRSTITISCWPLTLNKNTWWRNVTAAITASTRTAIQDRAFTLAVAGIRRRVRQALRRDGRGSFPQAAVRSFEVVVLPGLDQMDQCYIPSSMESASSPPPPWIPLFCDLPNHRHHVDRRLLAERPSASTPWKSPFDAEFRPCIQHALDHPGTWRRRHFLSLPSWIQRILKPTFHPSRGEGSDHLGVA